MAASSSLISVPIPTKYFPALTGVRAIAALLVFLYHAAPKAFPDSKFFLVTWLLRLGQQSYVGVSIFFVLSGFLITLRYATSITLTGSWFRKYLQNRFARIYPLYFLLTVCSFAVMLVHPLHTWYEWPATAGNIDKLVAVWLNLTLTRAFFHPMVFVGVPTAWTLTIEESFYLSAPFLLWSLWRNSRLFCVLPILLLLTGVGVVMLCGYMNLPYGLMASVSMMLDDTFFGRCIEFFVGIGLAWCLQRRPRLLSTSIHATVLGAAGILVLMVMMSLMEHSLLVEPTTSDYARLLVNNILLPLPIASLLWGIIHERTWLQRLLQSRLLTLLGKSSYAFYLIHLGVGDTLFCIFVSDNWVVRLVAYVLISIGLYSWVERPLHKRLRVNSPIVELAYS
jgi:peptidoglycan/LPS O-acetylase OafA/YrhL